MKHNTLPVWFPGAVKEEQPPPVTYCWIEKSEFPPLVVADLNVWRERLYRRGLIGMHASGAARGGISKRLPAQEHFIISGAGTGGMRALTGSHYSRVVHAAPADNALVCEGPLEAPGEAFLHAAVYAVQEGVGAVLHVHDLVLWRDSKGRIEETDRNAVLHAEAGEAIKNFLSAPWRLPFGLISLGGRPGELLSFGKNLEEAAAALFAAQESLRP